MRERNVTLPLRRHIIATWAWRSAGIAAGLVGIVSIIEGIAEGDRLSVIFGLVATAYSEIADMKVAALDTQLAACWPTEEDA